jgi:hypothetical protein
LIGIEGRTQAKTEIGGVSDQGVDVRKRPGTATPKRGPNMGVFVLSLKIFRN